MRPIFKVLFTAVTVLAFSPQDHEYAPFEFGWMRASLNGREFTGTSGRDSVLAVWIPAMGELRIEGDNRSRGGRRVMVRFKMRCDALPRVGTYTIGDPFSPVTVEALSGPTLGERIWPIHGARYRVFFSEGTPLGTLVLDAVDSAHAIIKGHFTVSLRSFDRPPEMLSARGTFFGRLDPGERFPKTRTKWPARFRTDCERVRDAVWM